MDLAISQSEESVLSERGWLKEGGTKMAYKLHEPGVHPIYKQQFKVKTDPFEL